MLTESAYGSSRTARQYSSRSMRCPSEELKNDNHSSGRKNKPAAMEARAEAPSRRTSHRGCQRFRRRITNLVADGIVRHSQESSIFEPGFRVNLARAH